MCGLPQSPCKWNAHLHNFVTSIGLTRSALNHCVYMETINSAVVLLAVLVDDILIAPASDIAPVKMLFIRSIQSSILGVAEEFLSIRIRQRAGLIILIRQYIGTVLDKYQYYIGVRNCANVPSMSKYIAHDISPTTAKYIAYVDAFLYVEIVGSLLYFAVVTHEYHV